MERRATIAGAPEVNVTVRVRGMSQEQRFFDVQTFTTRVTGEFIVVLLGEQVELETELHVTNMRNQVGGTFRVAWTSFYIDAGTYRVGLELLDPEGEIWDEDSLLGGEGNVESLPPVQLACRRCSGSISIEVPEAEPAALAEGFLISRHCDTCKATTVWAFGPAAAEPAAAPQEPILIVDEPGAPGLRPAVPLKENREKGRAPIKLGIKITRSKYGLATHDIGETINVSRSGAYFATSHSYEPGEIVDVILPYHPEGLQIPVKARVIRQDETPGTYKKRVAIHLLSGPTAAR